MIRCVHELVLQCSKHRDASRAEWFAWKINLAKKVALITGGRGNNLITVAVCKTEKNARDVGIVVDDGKLVATTKLQREKNATLVCLSTRYPFSVHEEAETPREKQEDK